jgi:membrane fusion protein, multidrug efflux system
MKRTFPFFILASTSAMVLAAAGCKHEETAAASAKNSAPDGGGRRGGNLQFAVDVMDVQSRKVDYVVQAPGQIDAFERVQVTARVAGVVDKVAFAEGQQVKKGDLLVAIESERYQLAVNSAKAIYEKAVATQKDTEASVARREGASKDHPGLIPGEELATYQTKALTAKADTQAAQEAVNVAQVNLRDSYARAPIEGTMQTRTVETGQYVQTGYLMATLLRNDPMLLHFQVEPQDAPRLKNDMVVNFSMRETPNSYTAKITLVAGAADPTTHTVLITAEVDNKSKKYWLRPGSFCDVSVDIGASRDAPVIPRTAVRPTDHGTIVYVIQGDTAVEKVVTLGMNTKDGWMEVRTGLTAGELLVVRGAEALTNGVHVKASKITSLAPDAPDPVPMQLDGGARPAGSGSGHRGGAKPPGSATP